MTGYELSRVWFNFSFEQKEAKVQHTAIYLWIVELNNRLGWKKEFGLPTNDTMEGLSIGHKQTYLNALKDLQNWGFIKIVKEAKNQYQSCIISICCTKSDTALDTALVQHEPQQRNGISNSTAPIDKPINKETNKPKTKETYTKEFEDFWALYEKPIGKIKSFQLWQKLSNEDRERIPEHLKFYKLSQPEVKFRKDPERYISYRLWDDFEPSKIPPTMVLPKRPEPKMVY